jgi:phosphatidylserine/phosphatidylglycerophosphate/cardiolipin synthase-like enzyme
MNTPLSISTLISKFFVAAADVSAPGESVPATSAGNIVTPLVDGDNYFGALRKEVDALKASSGTDKFFYFASWWLALAPFAGGAVAAGDGSTAWTDSLGAITPFVLDDESGPSFPYFIDELKAMAAAGTDVSAFGWVNPLVVQSQEAADVSGMYEVNASNLLSINAMRAISELATSAVIDDIGHPLGAMHLKMVVCGDATGGRAYVSGLDFEEHKVDGPRHPDGAVGGSGVGGWHDVGAKIEGPAVQAVYDYFQALWDETIAFGRPQKVYRVGKDQLTTAGKTATAGQISGVTVQIPDRTFTAAPGSMHVQVLRTGPQMNFSLGSTPTIPVSWWKRLAGGFAQPAWSFAPSGIFEFEPFLKKAIANAQVYIYVEDQGFDGWPIMDWLGKALSKNSNLKLIMLHRGDPADRNGQRLTWTAVNKHLAFASNMNSQVAFYERQDNVVVHSKTWIIDDQLVIIGSANCSRRSLYTDGEISIGVLDEDTTNNNLAIRYRTLLWGEHCGVYDAAGQSAFNDLATAILIWDPSWGIGGNPPPAVSAPGSLKQDPMGEVIFQRKLVPFEAGSNSDQWPIVDDSVDQMEYDRWDADSTQEY